ncbi:MAG: tRNA pseudouridine(55) synthase TruB [Actinomycetota bacterium]|nr:MAG: tRNA pseudouridine55 [Actinomycetota bacterium]MDO8949835.1 tRNA pseudouridine(55) synthase TruB [Actinomycetota bacterium]MDP3631086.1 tRNA pseudouridine(55) synthase TruB [Actinomycetota bacterium]
MGRRRGATGLAGVIVIDKPAGMTSHDVVAAVRRATGEGRVGHAGTLDPMATGVLVVLVGPYTRLEKYLSGHDKGYSATITFGSETDTDDAEGQVVQTAPVPAGIFDAEHAEEILRTFIGASEQLPPAYSAIKLDGKTSHEVARAGGALALAPRSIVVHDAHLSGFDADARTWDVDFLVSKGTYIRALARDIGRSVKSAAHLSALRRTRSGSVFIEGAHSLTTVVEHGVTGTIAKLFYDAPGALGFPLLVADSQADAIATGRPLALPEFTGGAPLFSVLVDGTLRAIYRREGERLVPETVLGSAQ